MVGLLLVGAAVAVALLVAASVRLPSLVSTLLVAYLALVANVGLVTWALSPLREVTRGGLAVAEAALLAAALGAWWLRGRPGLPVRAAGPAARELVRDPVVAVFLVLVAILLAYELVLALTVPPHNWDSLTYHLSRTAAWAEHGGIYRIPNAPTANFNEFQPLAEQQILFLFVAVGSAALFALPQYLAELAILVAVYGTARRLGFDARSAAGSALLVAMFARVAEQATSAQNDLFAASFPIVAACLVLGDGRLEHALGGAAAALGLGAKLTTLLVAPALLLLAAARGRAVLLRGLAGAAVGLVAVAMWSFVANLVHTGRLLGEEGTPATAIQPAEQQPLHASSWASAVDVLYQTLDLAPLSDRLVVLLAAAGVVAGCTVGALALRRTDLLSALGRAAIVALPLLAPVLMLAAGSALAYFSDRWGFPVRGPRGNLGEVNRRAESALFGPVGAVLFLGVPLLVLVGYRRGRFDLRHVALAAAVPVFFILLSQASYNWYLTRFLLVPAALCAPLFASLLRSRVAFVSYLGVAMLVIGLVTFHDDLRQPTNAYGAPWRLTQVEALHLTGEDDVADAVAALDRLVPERACIGAVLGPNEPAFLLTGRDLEHRVVYLPVDGAVDQAYAHFLSYVVLSTGPNGRVAGSFDDEGWTIRRLGGGLGFDADPYWLLVVSPHAGDGDCRR